MPALAGRARPPDVLSHGQRIGKCREHRWLQIANHHFHQLAQVLAQQRIEILSLLQCAVSNQAQQFGALNVPCPIAAWRFPAETRFLPQASPNSRLGRGTDGGFDRCG